MNFNAAMPFGGKNAEKMSRSGRREIVTAAVEGYAERGDFQGTSEIINHTAAGALYSTDERKKLTREFENRFIKKQTDKWNIETREHTRMQRERTETQALTEATLFSQLVEAKTPVERQQVLDQAEIAVGNQMMSRAGFSAITANQSRVNKQISTDKRAGFTVQHLQGKSLQELRPQIIAQMADGTLSSQDGIALIANLTAQAKREEQDPEYKRQKALSKEYVKARVKPSGFSPYGMIYGAKEKQTMVEINEEVNRLEAKGKSPMDAARMATAKVIGLQQFSDSPDMDIVQRNDNIVELQKYGASVSQKYKSLRESGKSTKAQKLKTKETIDLIKLRINYLKQKAEYDRVLKIDGEIK